MYQWAQKAEPEFKETKKLQLVIQFSQIFIHINITLHISSYFYISVVSPTSSQLCKWQKFMYLFYASDWYISTQST